MVKLKDYGTNVIGLQASLRMLPGAASAELRSASVEIAADVALLAQGKAAAVGRVYALVGPTIRASRDRVPVIAEGGSKSLPPHSDGRPRKGDRQTVGDVLWGAEFGGGARPSTRQFLPHLGTLGYALWPAVREHSAETREQYSAALQRALEAI